MMSQRQKRQVYIGLALTCLVLFAAGLIAGYHNRHSAICDDGRPPKSQQDVGIGQVRYLCHDGKIVTK
ncbi:MAG TPA: hypothetical protein VL086_03400 [Candidatus Nitrosotalea sp.]|nr:hypothetical protein [Candidatus Nitrosotalea sp.]